MELGYPDYWTPMRTDLRSWFERNAPSLGELYQGALEMVSRSSFPGRVRFVAHAVREIRNRLPDVIAGPKAGIQLQYKNRLDDMVTIWEKAGLPLDGSLPIKVTESGFLPASDDVLIPRNVYDKVVRLLGDHKRTRETAQETARRLFQAIDLNNRTSEETLRPRIDNWLKVTEWFVERAHERGETDVRMGDDQLKRRFEAVEYALSGMVREFFKTVETLDEILKEANS